MITKEQRYEYEDLCDELRDEAKDKFSYENRATGLSILLDEAADAIETLLGRETR